MNDLTFLEASIKLGSSLSTVKRMVREGILRPVYEGTSPRIRADDLAAIQELRYQNLTLPEIAGIAKIAAARISTLERQVNRLTELIGVDIPVLSTDSEDVIRSYAEVEVLLDQQELPVSDVAFIVLWSRRFYATGEEQFQLIADHTADPEPWAKVLKLATRMLMEKPKHQDIELEHAYRYLLVGRRFMRQAAYFYIREKHGSQIANRMFREVEGGLNYKILSIAFPPE